MIQPIYKQSVKVKIFTVDLVMAVWRKLLPSIWKSVCLIYAQKFWCLRFQGRIKNFQQQKCGNTREMTGIKQLVLIQHVRLPITALQMLNLDVATSLKMFGRAQPMFVIRSDSEDILVHTALHKPQQIL